MSSLPSSVSLCVVILELADEGLDELKLLHYRAPKYNMEDQEGKGLEFVTVDKDKSKAKGLRQLHPMSVQTYVPNKEYNPPGGGSTSSSTSTIGRDPVDADTVERQKIPFVSGHPFMELTKGLIHLYKENERTPLDGSEKMSQMLLMLGVPASVSCRDMTQFVAPFQADIENMKIIRDSVPNQYMVLIKLKGQKEADNFYQAFNGITFNSFEEDLCNLAYVARVETMKEADGIGLPLVGHTELPTCAVCLERMDESVDGILTILCNHSFHAACLSKCGDARCPVCRSVQTPELAAVNQCFECKSSESVWICLVCGHIGCGRYVHGHAYKHFCETSHCYAIQPDNNRVWDYVGDNFVHRLLQNKDGKLVEVEGRGAPRQDDHRSKGDDDEKLDTVQLEFAYMLTTQLDSQRFYFEEKLAAQNRDTQRELEKLNIRLEENDQYKKDTERRLSDLSKDRVQLEKKITHLTQRLNKAYADLKDEKELNKHLNGDHEKWQSLVRRLETEHAEYVKEKTAEITDLKEQLRDLMFFIEGGKLVEDSPLKDEILDGQVVVGPAASTSKKDRRKITKR